MISQNRTSNVGFVTPWPTDDAGISRHQAREIQQALLNRGYDIGQADGMIGDKTRYAIQDFQRQQGVNPDGRAGMKLYRMLVTQPAGNAQYQTNTQPKRPFDTSLYRIQRLLPPRRLKWYACQWARVTIVSIMDKVG